MQSAHEGMQGGTPLGGLFDPLNSLHASMQILSNGAPYVGAFDEARLQEDEDLNNQIKLQIEQANKRKRDAFNALEQLRNEASQVSTFEMEMTPPYCRNSSTWATSTPSTSSVAS